jgi:hypothetical protein
MLSVIALVAVADDLFGGRAATAARQGVLAGLERQIGRPGTERIQAALSAASGAARARAADAASALLSRLSGELAASRQGQLADQQISAGGGLKIALDPQGRQAARPASPSPGASRVQSFESGSGLLLSGQ